MRDEEAKSLLGVGAVGAAYRAKDNFINPPDMKKTFDTPGTWEDIEQGWQEELRRRGENGHRDL